MRDLLLGLRSALLWTASILHFVPAACITMLLGRLVGSRRADPFLRLMCRNIIRLTGARLRVTRSPDWDPSRPVLYAANHVNVFDPFFIVGALDTYARGIELESHFRVPVYGLLMKTMGNVPVPDRLRRGGFEVMRERVGASVAAGTSLVFFPEGSRTRTGSVGRFRSGIFRMAVELGIPVVPVSQRGAFQLKRVGRARLSPATVSIRIHAPLDPGDDPEALAERVRRLLVADVDGAAGPGTETETTTRGSAPR